ncbi:hypothetical protein ASPACDRAFT_39900 [Aspergillus aculeatus ATCC 16872]|uniref:Uncharacterized protein n=1 Tax=Aspergillus aculeatus (strain ATCC 16872 / CBS 172.66 / WB 5094) TaxID=690307 RepID=A0A1L9X2B2_ASPA1|nr:uncharacterized protein ASPACDRAFT_39900 [Aspergillus aculeatus ATCC 16872]OJK02593.1 hypothetical protein ASPACDRAFT_39900 [Aspergillus aculeatus ATCC 16872]
MEANSKDAVSGRWIETLRAIFPESEGYTLNVTIHEHRGSENHDGDDTDDNNFTVYERLAVYCSAYQGEIFSTVLEYMDPSSVADYAIRDRAKFLFKEWPATLLPIPMYGGVIVLNDVFVYGFRAYCMEPWCDLDLVCDDPQHFKKEEFARLFRLSLDLELEVEGLRVDNARQFTAWLAGWKASLVAKGPARSLSFQSLMQVSGQAPEVGESICPALEGMSLGETRMGPHWLHTPGGVLPEVDEFRLPGLMQRHLECSLQRHLVQDIEDVCPGEDISPGSLSPGFEGTREDFLVECLGDAPEPALDGLPDCMELELFIEEATRNSLLQLLDEEDHEEFD